jgi:hypothetical protein
VRGYLQALTVSYGGTPAATTDSIISEAEGLGRTIQTLTDHNSPAPFNPMDKVTDEVGADTGVRSPYFIGDTRIKVAVAQGVINTPRAVVVKLQILEV